MYYRPSAHNPRMIEIHDLLLQHRGTSMAFMCTNIWSPPCTGRDEQASWSVSCGVIYYWPHPPFHALTRVRKHKQWRSGYIIQVRALLSPPARITVYCGVPVSRLLLIVKSWLQPSSKLRNTLNVTRKVPYLCGPHMLVRANFLLVTTMSTVLQTLW